MEGEADANNDNEITAGELHSYVQTGQVGAWANAVLSFNRQMFL